MLLEAPLHPTQKVQNLVRRQAVGHHLLALGVAHLLAPLEFDFWQIKHINTQDTTQTCLNVHAVWPSVPSTGAPTLSAISAAIEIIVGMLKFAYAHVGLYLYFGNLL